jgi:hypothetical protein
MTLDEYLVEEPARESPCTIVSHSDLEQRPHIVRLHFELVDLAAFEIVGPIPQLVFLGLAAFAVHLNEDVRVGATAFDVTSPNCDFIRNAWKRTAGN